MSQVIDRALCVAKLAYWRGQVEKALYTPTRDTALRDKVVATCRDRIAAWQRRLAALDRLHGEGPPAKGAA